jgi:hypothetical protein
LRHFTNLTKYLSCVCLSHFLLAPFSLGAEAVQVFNDIFIPGLTASLSLPVLLW